MRIRRHANLDVAAGSGAAFFRPSLCVLNQSPWDVIPFSPDSPLQGFWVARPGDDGGGDEVADWDAGVDGTPAVVGEVKEEDDPSQEQHHLAPISKFRPAELPAAGVEEEEEEGGKGVMCAKRGGKGWRCGTEARKGGALCDHHAALRQCYRSHPQPAAGKSRRRGSAKPGGGGSDYYYYSGFGPRWRKRRGKESVSESERHVPEPAMPDFSAADSAAGLAPATESGSGEGSGGEGGGRRRRKPMKKRSLMSLL